MSSSLKKDHTGDAIYHTALFFENSEWVPYVLPSDWILDDLKTAWPPRDVDYFKAMKYNYKPSNNWQVFEYRLLAKGQKFTFEKARQRSVRALNETDPENSEADKTKRRIFAKKVAAEFMDETVKPKRKKTQSQVTTCEFNRSFSPPVGDNFRQIGMAEDLFSNFVGLDQLNEEQHDAGRNDGAVPIALSPNITVGPTVRKQLFVLHDQGEDTATKPSSNVSQGPNQIRSTANVTVAPAVSSPQIALTPGESLILRKIESIKRDVDFIKKVIADKNVNPMDFEDDTDDTLPLNSKEEMDNFNQKLGDKSTFQKYVLQLSDLEKQKGIKSSTKLIMLKLIGNQFALKCNMPGGYGKESFQKQQQIHKLVRAAVRHCFGCAKAKNCQIDDRILSFFHNSKDRVEGRVRKSKRTRNQQMDVEVVANSQLEFGLQKRKRGRNGSCSGNETETSSRLVSSSSED